ncbi:hypothetical protein ACWEN3_01865 [Streptomyces sp. NPDC004561]
MDAGLEAALVAAVRDRSPDTSPVQALRAHMLGARAFKAAHEERMASFLRLVTGTPALVEPPAHVDAARTRPRRGDRRRHRRPRRRPGLRGPRHLALESRALTGTPTDPEATVNAAFDLLEKGWEGVRPTPGRPS